MNDLPVTIVMRFHDGRMILKHGRLLGRNLYSVRVHFWAGSHFEERILAAGMEGVAWRHGHHNPDSEEAQALLAAFTLVNPSYNEVFQ